MKNDKIIKKMTFLINKRQKKTLIPWTKIITDKKMMSCSLSIFNREILISFFKTMSVLYCFQCILKYQVIAEN